jgi:hypothetical protein
LGIALCGIQADALTAEPGSVLFESLEETATVSVMDNGSPVAIESVKGHELYVGENTYGYMIDVSAESGKLRIRPKILEAGSYLLVVNTNLGEVRVNVYAPLSALPNTYEEQAAMLNIPVEELKQRLGVTQTLARSAFNIDLPPVYYVGQTLRITLEPSQNTRTWSINGAVVTEGVNANQFDYTFKEPGDYLLTYVESRDGAVVASDTAVTRVMAMPPVVTEVKPNTEVILNGPQGYTAYTWTAGGPLIGQDRVLRYKAVAPGEYTLTCRAEGSAKGGDTFEEVRYVIRVK